MNRLFSFKEIPTVSIKIKKMFYKRIKTLGKLIFIIFILLFLWEMLATTSPIKPHRAERYSACDINNISSWETTGGNLIINSHKSALEPSTNYIEFINKKPRHQPSFWCQFPIPETILYKAITLNVTYKLNQPAYFDVGIRRVGMGPGWKPVKIDEDNVNKIITSTWLLNDPDQRKLNWLSGSYEGVTFGISKFDPDKELILSVYQVYFE